MIDSSVSAPYVQTFLALPFLLLGASHIFQAGMWKDFFVGLHTKGKKAVIWRSFVLEIWPATAVVAFHQIWSGPAIILTIYGHLLMAKISISLLAPQWGLKSLAMAKTHGESGFVTAGFALVAMGLLLAWLIFFG